MSWSFNSILAGSLLVTSALTVAQQPSNQLHVGEPVVFTQSLAEKIDPQNDLLKIRVGEQSQPHKGFYSLERKTESGQTVNAGYIQLSDNKKLTVLNMPNGKSVQIVEKDGDTIIRELVTALPSKPLKPATQRQPKLNAPPLKISPQPLSNIVSEQNTTSSQQVEVPTVDVLWIMDPRLPAFANSEGYDFELTFANRKDVSQQIYANSGPSYQFADVGLYAFQYNGTLSGFPAETSGDVLEWLQTDPRINYLADLHDADVIHYLGATDSQICGKATLASNLNEQNQLQHVFGNNAVGYSRIACPGSTVAHELGHNLSLRHDRSTIEEDGGSTVDYKINYGFITEDASAYTTMAYGTSCANLEGECNAAEQFSDPDKLLNGVALGKTEAEIDAANGVRALSQVTPSMALMAKASDLQSLQIDLVDDSNAVVSWLAQAGASEYYLINNFDFCTFSVLRGDDISDATVTQQTEALVGISGGLGLCVVAKIEFADGSSGYQAVGQARLNTLTNGEQVEAIVPRNNVIDLFTTTDSAEIELNLTDTETVNSDLALGVLLSADDEVNNQQQAISDASQWFNFSVTGSGETRTATITLKEPLPEILAAMSPQDARALMHLPLSIVNAQKNNFAVSADIWLEPKPDITPISAYFSDQYRLTTNSNVTIRWQLNDVPASLTPVISQTGSVTLQNSTTTQTRINGGDDIEILISGDVPATNEPGEWQVTADFDSLVHPPISQALAVSGSNTPPSVDEIIVAPEEPIAGNEFVLEFKISDLDNDISVGSAMLTREVSAGEVKEYLNDTLTNTYSSYTIDDLQEAGTYTFTYSIEDIAGNITTELVEVTVVPQNTAPVIENIALNKGDLEAGDSVTLTVTASDAETASNDLSYVWEQLQGPSVSLAGNDGADLTLSDLAQGEYTLEATVTDEAGMSASATTSFTVAEQPEEPPADDDTGNEGNDTADSEGSSGGSSGWLFMLLALGGFILRRKS